MKIFNNRFLYIVVLTGVALCIRLGILRFIEEDYGVAINIVTSIVILFVGAFFILRGSANVIEETTEVLSERTKLASGFLQSLGTAFPDMVLGLVAAVISVSLVSTDYSLAIKFAIIAAATTFGSNIYNIGHAAWCIYRQNKANAINKSVMMFPGIKQFGTVIPLKKHIIKPSLGEMDNSLDMLNVLTLLTALTAITMVVFGKVSNPPAGIEGDLYQLIRPVGIILFIVCIFVLYHFRKTKREEVLVEKIVEEDKYYREKSTFVILINLLFAGAAILLAAESMIHAIETIADISGLPYVVAGIVAGIIGCLGEMIVVHNFTVNPKGRVGDAIVGVAMDNIVTTLGASIVAIMGGIFLGGNALILIFVIILALNGVLMWQISKLKNSFLPSIKR